MVVALAAVVCAVIGSVTTIALHQYLFNQLDTRVTEVGKRAVGPPDEKNKPLRPDEGTGLGPGTDPGTGAVTDPGTGAVGSDEDESGLGWVIRGGQAYGTLGAVVSGGKATQGQYSKNTEAGMPSAVTLTDAQLDALNGVPRDLDQHTVEIPGLGEYRVAYATDGESGYFVGLPTADVEATLDTLIVIEVCVTGAGLIAAALAGTAMVGVALRPLRRVAATATRVSELPLHVGEVALHERVPDAEADPRTEVGQVGAALNRMLGHVGAALTSRQESEMRVRQFVADASHELRTPLASIRGYAELTRRGREQTGPDTRHALGRIESEAHRMTGLVEDLLLLARLDAGRPLSYQECDLSMLVVDAVSDAQVAGRDHKWRLELADEPAMVNGDGARLHQVLVNLLANARTHTPPGTTVTARVLRQGPWVTLEVEDDGQGIPHELIPHVFERFARGDASRSRSSGGRSTGAGSTGLGLAIVQAVVTAHDGQVQVDSRPGRTVFAVHLPVTHSQAQHSRATQM
ncbi:cell wall metabolism sensor histidine kinase WalK [Streptomyces sp. GC420]|uniref:sensor histidine kinase n=1 Tax=Streptomyces sp. GC420 TaxID=2697568 RepID=UPI0014152210|nr:HAMP domain-containing sensor histidine kinase [Streptomyces sp. GC420]NBM19827.1 HAMP domain-containing protein [Streptomyces sp. GC420]